MGPPDSRGPLLNLLVDAFARQLSLKKEVPPVSPGSPTPTIRGQSSPTGFAPHWLNDISYYKGQILSLFRSYARLLLFWPWVVLTGHYFFHKHAVAVFCSVGFLAAGLLGARRRYFPKNRRAWRGRLARTRLTPGLRWCWQRPALRGAVSWRRCLRAGAGGGSGGRMNEPARRGRWLVAGQPGLWAGDGRAAVDAVRRGDSAGAGAQAWAGPAKAAGRRRWGLLAAAVGPSCSSVWD